MHYLTRLLIAAILLTPVAALAQLDVNAGADVVLECASHAGTEYTLNGSAPSGADISIQWTTLPEVHLDGANTLTPTGVFPLGVTTATLTAQQTGGASGSDSATITVQDTTPPVVHAQADPFVLWPPNHSMRMVEIEFRLRDLCDERGELTVELVDVMSDEPDNGHGDGNTANDIQGAVLGTDDRSVSLRAERAGGGDSRVYTLIYRISDTSGNQTDAHVKIYAPHDAAEMRRLLGENDDDDDLDDMADICTRPAAAVELFTDAIPSVSSFGSGKACERGCKTWAKGCTGMVRSTSRCAGDESKSLSTLQALACSNIADRGAAQHCRDDARAEAGNDAMELRGETSDATEICNARAERCANACEDFYSELAE